MNATVLPCVHSAVDNQAASTAVQAVLYSRATPPQLRCGVLTSPTMRPDCPPRPWPPVLDTDMMLPANRNRHK